jgi:putative peptide zinc metalloprotease protein
MGITLKSNIKLHPIEMRKDKKNYIVEDLTTGEFFEMPEVCVVAIEKINAGFSLGDIEENLKIQFPEEEVSLLDFVEQLLSLELVEEIDGSLIELKEKEREKLGLTVISPNLGKVFFNNKLKLTYIILFLLNISLLIINPDLFPHFKDVFIFDVMFQNIILWFIIGGILVLFHELGHILAIRAHDLPTKLEVGHRLFFIVLETDLSLGWKLSSKERIFVYLSGMCFDNVVLFLALIAQILFPNAPEIFTSLMAFVVLDVVIRLIYQCCVYMKTDLYYVLENLTGCHNLMENTKEFIFKRQEAINVFKGEIKTIKIYSVFYFLGLALSFLLFVCYYIPQLAYTLIKVTPGLKSSIYSVEFLDSVVVLGQFVIVLGLLTYSWTKNLNRKSEKQIEESF